MLTSRTPSLDLHGEERAMVYSLVNEFILDNYKMGVKEVLIIHGKSTNILTKEVHEVLKYHKKVLNYHLDSLNLGVTIVNLQKM